MKPTMLLICPPSLSTRSELYFPTNFTILSAALKNAGFDVKILDLNLLAALQENTFYDDPLTFSLRAIEDNVNHADFFGLTTLCANYPLILQLASILKQRFNKPVILGGIQASMTALRTMELFPYIDFIVAYEGEVTIVELLKSICEHTDPKDVKGLFYRRNGDIYSTPFRPFIENLDDSPFPDFAALDIKSYLRIDPGVRIPVDIGRGCPHKCTFCSSAMMWKRSFRMKSPQRAVAEIDALHNQFGVSNFFFTQDNLTTKKSYVHELCRALKGKNYTWGCYSRCDTLDDEMLEAMISGGCRHIFFGIETGSQPYQKTIKKNLNLADAQKSIKLCISHGIDFTTSYIIGFPEEDREDISLTLKSCFRDAARNVRSMLFNILSPMPGTELASKYQERLTSPLATQLYFSPFLLKNNLAEEGKKMITAYPDIFSSFYFIKPTHFELSELFDIGKFFYVLMDAFPRTTHLILQYSPLKSLDLLDLYRKMGLALDLKGVDAQAMSRYYLGIIDQQGRHPRDMDLLIREVLKYELVIYQIRTTPTSENLYESQSNAAALDVEKFQPEQLSFSPSLISSYFRVNISNVLELFPFEDYRYEPLQTPLDFIFYEDAVNGDIVLEKVDPEMRTFLDDLRESNFRNFHKWDRRRLLELIKKGIVIYRKK